VPPVEVPYKMAGGKLERFDFPPRLNYSLDALRETNESQYRMIVMVLEEIAENEFGLTGPAAEVHKKYSDYIIRTGLIRPVFKEDEEGITIHFDMWSYSRRKYVHYTELEPYEAMFSDYYFSRMFNVN